MSFSSPADREPSDRTRKASRLIVCAAAGRQPTRADETDEYVVKTCKHSAGGERVDAIVLEHHLAKTGHRLQDTVAVAGALETIQVRRVDVDEEGNDRHTLLAWGDLVHTGERLSRDEERNDGIVARVENYHFGNPFEFFYINDPTDDTPQLVRDELVFNPVIDGKVQGNRSELQGDNDEYLVVHPESVQTQAARVYQGTSGNLWGIVDAVQALCWWLNPDQTWVVNPTRETLERQFAAAATTEAGRIRNVRIPLGTYLPQALDLLLRPLGYGWFQYSYLIDPEEEGGDETMCALRFYKRNAGIARSCRLPRIGETRTHTNSDVAEYDALYSYVDLANVVKGFSDVALIEGTFPLKIGWPTADDTLDLYTLTGEIKRDVGRKFVLDEAGDYIGLRAGYDGPTDLTGLNNQVSGLIVMTRRRKFEQTISKDAYNDSLGTIVEYYDPDGQNGAPAGWFRVKWPYSVLEKECGIVFEGTRPPERLWELLQTDPDTVQVRITACIRGDRRVWGIAERRDTSPQGNDIQLTLDLERKYPWRLIADSDDGFDSVAGTYGAVTPADEIDPSTPSGVTGDRTIQQFVEQVRETTDFAQLSGSIRLEGVDLEEFQIGQLVKDITGRNITFDCRIADPEDADSQPLRPQIVGINLHLEGDKQITELCLETFRQEIPS